MYLHNVFLCLVVYTCISISWCSLFSNPNTPNTASLLTFNTALLPQAPNYAVRRTETAAKIKEINADVVCLQEVWFSDDLRNILNENDADIYPYSFSNLHQGVGDLPDAPASAPCLTTAFQAVFSCFQTNCAQYAADPQATLVCAIVQCDIFDVLDQQCLSCIVTAGLGTLDSRCLTGAIGVQMNEPGLLMLSKFPLTNVHIQRYIDSDTKLLLPRAYITAEIDGLGTIACTHATSFGSSEMDTYIENLDFGSWAAQNQAEMYTLVNALADDRKVVIMGDLNTSPTLEPFNIIGEIEESYNFLVSSGYFPTHYWTWNRCTYCLENAITSDTLQGNKIIDHVLVRRVRPIDAKRVLDEDPSDPLSDHYGVMVTVFKNPSTN